MLAKVRTRLEVEGNQHESHAGFTSDNRIEREADCFAVGLLMPKHLFKDAMPAVGDGLSAIEHLADRCQTSLTATSIRFAQLSDAPMAIVLSTKDRIDYCLMSDGLKNLDGIDWIRKNSSLPENTATDALIKRMVIPTYRTGSAVAAALRLLRRLSALAFTERP